MKYLIYSFLGILMCLPHTASGQVNEVHGNPNVWFLLLNHYEVSSRWKIGNEIHLRRDAWLADQQQFIVRPFVVFKAAEGVEAVAGYSYLLTSPYGDYPLLRDQPEHNFWEQITLSHRVNKVGISHRYRMEHRFRGNIDATTPEPSINGFNFSNRFRYRLTLTRDLNSKLFLAAFDELWVNFTDRFQLQSFDRNWLYGALGWRMVEQGNIQLGYMHQWGRNTETRFERHHTVQVVVQYDF